MQRRECLVEVVDSAASSLPCFFASLGSFDAAIIIIHKIIHSQLQTLYGSQQLPTKLVNQTCVSCNTTRKGLEHWMASKNDHTFHIRGIRIVHDRFFKFVGSSLSALQKCFKNIFRGTYDRLCTFLYLWRWGCCAMHLGGVAFCLQLHALLWQCDWEITKTHTHPLWKKISMSLCCPKTTL